MIWGLICCENFGFGDSKHINYFQLPAHCSEFLPAR